MNRNNEILEKQISKLKAVEKLMRGYINQNRRVWLGKTGHKEKREGGRHFFPTSVKFHTSEFRSESECFDWLNDCVQEGQSVNDQYFFWPKRKVNDQYLLEITSNILSFEEILSNTRFLKTITKLFIFPKVFASRPFFFIFHLFSLLTFFYLVFVHVWL